jgi:hypothetical protein
MDVGVAEVRTGTGLSRVTEALPDFVASLDSAAETVTVLGAGGNSGAVYRPPALIRPRVALPPATPFTDQVKAG